MRHVTTALASIVLAVLVWFYARSRDVETLQRVETPVRFTLAPGEGQFWFAPSNESMKTVVLANFKGPRAEITALRARLTRGDLVVERQLSRPLPSQRAPQRMTVAISPSDFPWFPGVGVSLVPGSETVNVTVVPVTTRKMQVQLNLSRADRELVKSQQIDPPVVDVTGPVDLLDRHEKIPTEPFDISAAADSTEETVHEQDGVPLAGELAGAVVKAQPERVRIKLVLKRRLKIYSLAELPVRFLVPEDFRFAVKAQSLRPASVSLRVRGPVLEDLDPREVKVFVDLTAAQLKPGLYSDEKLRVHLPDGFQLMGDPPKVERFEIVAPGPGSPAPGAPKP